MKRQPSDICKFTLLYVDKESEATMVLLRNLINNYPMQDVIYCTNGFDGAYTIKNNAPDIFIIDSKINIVEVLLVAREVFILQKFKELLLLSNQEDIDMLNKCNKIGGINYVVKPITTDSLFDRIDCLMEGLFVRRLLDAKEVKSRNRITRLNDDGTQAAL